jgi:hypothetical protein
MGLATWAKIWAYDAKRGLCQQSTKAEAPTTDRQADHPTAILGVVEWAAITTWRNKNKMRAITL